MIRAKGQLLKDKIWLDSGLSQQRKMHAYTLGQCKSSGGRRQSTWETLGSRFLRFPTSAESLGSKRTAPSLFFFDHNSPNKIKEDDGEWIP